MIPTRLYSIGWFPYKSFVAYQRCVDNPTINYELGALRQLTPPFSAEYPGVFWWCCGSVLTLDSLPASSHVETQQNCVAVGSNFGSMLCRCGGTPHALLGSEGMHLW